MLVQALLTQPAFVQNPYLSPHPPQKKGASKKKSRNFRCDVPTKVTCEIHDPIIEVGWAVAAFGDLYKSIVKVLQINKCQY